MTARGTSNQGHRRSYLHQGCQQSTKLRRTGLRNQGLCCRTGAIYMRLRATDEGECPADGTRNRVLWYGRHILLFFIGCWSSVNLTIYWASIPYIWMGSCIPGALKSRGGAMNHPNGYLLNFLKQKITSSQIIHFILNQKLRTTRISA